MEWLLPATYQDTAPHSAMLERTKKLALYMEGALTHPSGKMGFGILRYSPNPVACVVDSRYASKKVEEVIDTPREAPVVASIKEAIACGAEVLVLAIAPPGGLIPPEWWPAIDEAVAAGLSIVNGLHDLVAPRYPDLQPAQWIWDIRLEPPGLGVGDAVARTYPNKRVLMIGTDMAVGKMTAGLEIYRAALASGVRAEFVATGQIGITIMGSGVPLDAVRVDYASGAIEREMVRTRDAELVIVEGQGALIHPASTANLPLLRGSCPTHLILCHRAGQTELQRVPWVKIPPLREYAALYEELGSALGVFPRPVLAGVALNTSGFSEEEALRQVSLVEAETGVPCVDPVRHGAGRLLQPLVQPA